MLSSRIPREMFPLQIIGLICIGGFSPLSTEHKATPTLPDSVQPKIIKPQNSLYVSSKYSNIKHSYHFKDLIPSQKHQNNLGKSSVYSWDHLW